MGRFCQSEQYHTAPHTSVCPLFTILSKFSPSFTQHFKLYWIPLHLIGFFMVCRSVKDEEMGRFGQDLVEKEERNSGRMMENEERKKKKTRPISCYSAYGLHEGVIEAV